MFRPLCSPLQEQVSRGGWRQRLDHAAEADVIRPPPLQALAFLQEWGDGETSAIRLARLLQHSIDDGEVKHPMVVRLGRVAAGAP
eukprot:2497577-Alexandrium_andersonii.AAC.1